MSVQYEYQKQLLKIVRSQLMTVNNSQNLLDWVEGKKTCDCPLDRLNLIQNLEQLDQLLSTGHNLIRMALERIDLSMTVQYDKKKGKKK